MMRFMKRTMRAFAKSEQGVALIEFAYCISLLMLMLWGGIEVSRYVLIMQKLQDAASQEINIIGTINPKSPPTAAEMLATLRAVSLMMDPYAFTFSGSNMIIVTDIAASISTVPANPIVQWRYCSPALSGSSTLSKFGAVGAKANLSGFPGFSMAAGDEIIVTEVYYQFSPIIKNAITTTILPASKPVYVESLGVPRFGSLATMIGPSGAFPSNCP